jgi:hypothetical protein
LVDSENETNSRPRRIALFVEPSPFAWVPFLFWICYSFCIVFFNVLLNFGVWCWNWNLIVIVLIWSSFYIVSNATKSTLGGTPSSVP